MKQLLTVIAITLFASLTQGFTIPHNTKNAKKTLTAATINYTFQRTNLDIDEEYYRIYVNNVLTIDLTSSGNGSFNVPEGSSVRLEAAIVSPTWPWLAFLAYVNDAVGQIYFKDDPGIVDFTFTATDGNTYELFVRD